MLDHQSLRGEFINKRNLVKHLRGKFTNDMFHTQHTHLSRVEGFDGSIYS